MGNWFKQIWLTMFPKYDMSYEAWLEYGDPTRYRMRGDDA
jgi:hypothetical protein